MQWCYDCASTYEYRCGECGEIYDSNYMIETVDGAWLCKWCHDSASQCSGCGDVYHDSDKIIGGMCMDCYDNNEQGDE